MGIKMFKFFKDKRTITFDNIKKIVTDFDNLITRDLNPRVTLDSEPTIDLNASGVIELNPPSRAKIQRPTGVYVDRVSVSENISEQELKIILTEMLNRANTRLSPYRNYSLSFKDNSGNILVRESQICNDFEIRLISTFFVKNNSI
jgi:hypothetical protein